MELFQLQHHNALQESGEDYGDITSDSDHEIVSDAASIIPTSSGDIPATINISGTSVLCSAYDTVINVIRGAS